MSLAGYCVESAFNGAQAMEWVRSRPPGVPALIILDVLMPVMDGGAFLAALARETVEAQLAVLVFTASTLDATQFRGISPVRGLLRKPSSTSEILKTVAMCWPEGGRARRTGRPEPTAPVWPGPGTRADG